MFLEIEVDLLENVLGLERDHAGLALEFLESIIELDGCDVPQELFSIPSPVKNLRSLGFGSD